MLSLLGVSGSVGERGYTQSWDGSCVRVGGVGIRALFCLENSHGLLPSRKSDACHVFIKLYDIQCVHFDDL